MSAGALTTCDYCGLPVPRGLLGWRRPEKEARPAQQYCCFGCRFAAAVTQERGEQGSANWTLTRLGIAIFLSMNVMVSTMALWTQDFYGVDSATEGGGAFTAVLRDLFRYLSLLFSLPVLFLLGGPLLEGAWAQCRRGILSTDMLLVLGVAASYLVSAVSVLRDNGPVYFEVGCAVLVLVTLGRWLEATCKLRTTASLESLHRLLPEQARRVTRGEGRGVSDEADDAVSPLATRHTTLIPLDAVAVGDCLRVLPGDHIPCDGVVARNSAMVDEQTLTGESQPVLKETGDGVIGGTLNLDGDLFVTVTSCAGAGTLARMIELVRQAHQSKGHYERLADRVTAWFLPAVVLIALLTLAWHGQTNFGQAILTALAVVVIACPCALGLATPMAVWIALGCAARAQVLFRNGESLERLASVGAIRFDKTGTLTTGSPTVAQFMVAEGENSAEVRQLAVALGASSNHCYARAIRAANEESFGISCRPQAGDGPLLPELRAVQTLPGRGISAEVADTNDSSLTADHWPLTTVFLGSQRLMAESRLKFGISLSAVATRAQQAGLSSTCIGWDGAVRGVFLFHEEIRPEAASSIAQLRALGIDVAVLTGDNVARGTALARELGLPVQAELLPEDKVVAVADARWQHGPVAMVGDGINDGPALAASDVGIALGCGTDVSRDSAAVCLLGNDLLHLPWAIDLARRTVRVIRQNLFWAFVYNILGIGLACTGRLNPVFAALAMVLSSFLVVANSLRLSGEFSPRETVL